jgi:hypothetical protein
MPVRNKPGKGLLYYMAYFALKLLKKSLLLTGAGTVTEAFLKNL